MKIITFLCAALFAVAAAGTADGQAAIDTTRVVSGLSYPVGVTYAPNDPERLFIIEKRGRIRVFHIGDDQLRSTYFLNIDSIVGGGTSTSSEQGLLGLAFHPDYADNGYFYVYYTNNSGNTVVQRYTVSANPEVASSSSGYQILTFSQNYSNHNGGWLGFDHDGYLRIGTGDGGGAGDTQGNGQNINNLNGCILRIDVDGGSPYGVPADNPYVNASGNDAIMAIGIRNAWRCSIDRETGAMYIGDVGQNAREEINAIPANQVGQNFGWRCREGINCYSSSCCNNAGFTDPVYHYAQGSSYGYCITGGHVYRGCAMPDYDGIYFFADYSTGNIFSMRWSGSGSATGFQQRNELETSSEGYGVDSISSFGEDFYGEIYICDQSGGEVFKIIPSTGDESCISYPVGDINEDCAVDGADLSLVLGYWNTSGSNGSDLNGDGTVDGADLTVFLGAWGQTCD